MILICVVISSQVNRLISSFFPLPSLFATLTYPTGKLNIRGIERLVRCIADLHNRGYEIQRIVPPPVSPICIFVSTRGEKLTLERLTPAETPAAHSR